MHEAVCLKSERSVELGLQVASCLQLVDCNGRTRSIRRPRRSPSLRPAPHPTVAAHKADRLLDDLGLLKQWPEKVKLMLATQNGWPLPTGIPRKTKPGTS
jgi:hypothetical protein